MESSLTSIFLRFDVLNRVKDTYQENCPRHPGGHSGFQYAITRRSSTKDKSSENHGMTPNLFKCTLPYHQAHHTRPITEVPMQSLRSVPTRE